MRLWALLCAYRGANALLICTYFNPDEFWQSLEVAHRLVYGYARLTTGLGYPALKRDRRYGHLTWEWERGLRSYFHPLIFAGVYSVLSLLGIDTESNLVAASIARLQASMRGPTRDFR